MYAASSAWLNLQNTGAELATRDGAIFFFFLFDLLDFEETDGHKIRVKWTLDSDYVLCWTCQLRGAFLLADAKVVNKNCNYKYNFEVIFSTKII